MDLQLNSKTAFISGSTQGIGFAIAKQMAKEGVTVIINGRTQEKINLAIQAITDEVPHAKVTGIAADFSSKEEVEKLMEQLPSVDILINNVGIFELKNFNDISDEEWFNIFNINVMSGVRLSRYFLEGMLSRNWGRIIFISSESGINVPGNMIHYGMTKTAMLSVSNGLSKLTKGTKVTVNTVLGGPTYSEGVSQAVKHIANQHNHSEEVIKGQIMESTNPHSLLGRFIETEEIASVITYLSSPRAAAINGASVRADGGVLNTL